MQPLGYMALVAVFGSDITICGAQGILTSECRHYDCGWMRSDIAIANTARCHWGGIADLFCRRLLLSIE